jgi:PAS domain S-box-containing protein
MRKSSPDVDGGTEPEATPSEAAVIVTDLDGVVLQWNPAAEALYGWTAAEANGRRVGDLLVPPGASAEADAIMEQVRSGRTWTGEFDIRTKDGRKLRVQVSDSLLHDADGRPVAIVGVSSDVTARRRAEQRLAIQYGVTQVLADATSIEEAAQEVLRSIGTGLGWAFAGLWRVDPRNDVLRSTATWWSGEGSESEFAEASATMTFARGVGLPGRVWASGRPAWVPDVTRDDNFPRAALAREAGLQGAFAFPIPLGEEILGVVEAFSSEVEEPDGELLKMVAAVGSQLGQFIEREEAEAATQAVEARRKAILEASLDALVAMDHEGRITEFNPAAEDMFGYRRDEVIGRELAELLIPAHLRERHRAGLAAYVQGGPTRIIGRQVELAAVRRDGTQFPIELAVTRVPLPGPPLFKGSIRDISARRRAEEQLEALLAAEKEARGEAEVARQRLAFLAEASTLLASTLGYNDALERLGRLAVTLIADICLIDILDDEGVVRRSVAVHADPSKQDLTSLLKDRYPPQIGGPHPAVGVMRTGKPVFSPIMTEQFLRETTRDEEHFRLVAQLGFQSYLCVPLIARGRTLGTVTLVSTDPRHRMGIGDVSLAEDLARRAGLMVDNARLYEAEQVARQSAERAVERTEALQAVTAALGEALTAEQVADVVADRGMEATGAAAAVLALLERDRRFLRIVRARGYGDRLLGAWDRFPVDGDFPLSEAVRTRRPVFLGSLQERLDRFPALTEGSDGADHAVACVPLLVEGRAIGGISVALPVPQAFDHEDQEFLLALAGQSAQALERARLYEETEAARAVSEAAERRMAFLAEASAILAQGLLDFEATLSNVARLAVPDFSDWCAVDLIESGAIRRVATAHVDAAKQALATDLQERLPLDPNAATGVPNVIRTGRPELLPDIPDELLVASIADPDLLELVRRLGLRSIMIVPLVARGRTLGAMTFAAAESGRHYGQADLVLAEELAQRAALAVDNARLYQDRSYVARTLQQTLLPPKLPRIPGVELAALYRPAGEGNEIGGDFYDMFETVDGTWGVVIGDVCGKGADAAAVIGVTRYTIRALAMQEQRPSTILGSLNEALRQQSLDERFCTVCYVRLRPGPGGVRLTVACAGHPLPFVIRDDGSWERVGEAGTLLGVFPDPDIVDRSVDLAPGDTLLLFTDGVTEERSGDRLFGEEGVAAVLERCAGVGPEVLLTNLSNAVSAFRPEAPRDDMAVIALRVTG